MRIFPVITAAAVAVFLYALVFERDRLHAPVQVKLEVQAAASPDMAGPVKVVVLRSTAQPVDNAVLARGRTEAARQVEVRSQTSGLVLSEPLRRGAYVTAGQVLCELAPGTQLAALAEAQARLAEAAIYATAAEQLGQQGFGTETKTVAARAALQSARADVQVAEAEIARLTLTAPFDGILETDTAELGALLQPGSACATVIQLNPLKLVAFIAEVDVDKVTVGALAGARLVTGDEIAGRVSFLSRSADPDTRTFRVEVTVANPDLAIRDGQTAEIRIAAEASLAHLLPGSALTLSDDGQLGVRVVDGDNLAQFIPVSLIRDTVDGVWLSGLADVADVIVVGQEFVVDGVEVQASLVESPRP